jgi:uncharacterized lipoprotein YmbA
MRVARDALGPGPLPLRGARGDERSSPPALQSQRWTGAQFALLALFLSACGTTPRESFYTLASAPPVESTAPAKMTVHVGPVAIPDTVDRTPMVIRKGPNEVEIEDFHRWAEPLKTGIPRALAANLARELGGSRVSSGRLGNTGADYQVTLDVSRFESSFSDGATLEATWTVIRKTGAPTTGRTLARAPAPSADYSGVASAHSRALEQLAREIAAAITSR